jgi:hypothetical protein
MALAKRIVVVGLAAFLLASVYLTLFPPVASRVFMNQRRAAESIRELNRAEYNYAARHLDAGFACNLRELGENAIEPQSGAAHVDRVLASGTKSSYRFDVRCPQGSSKGATIYTITAIPLVSGTTGKYALCSDQSREIWYSENGSAADCLGSRKPIEQKYR